MASDVCLLFVSQAVAEGKIRPESPVVLNVSAKVPLPDPGRRVAAGNRKLRRLASSRRDVGRPQTLLLKQQGTSIPFEAGYVREQRLAAGAQHYLIVRIKNRRRTSEEDICASKVTRREIVDPNASEPESKLQRVLFQRPGREVLYFKPVGDVVRTPDVRAASSECVQHHYRRNGIIADLLPETSHPLKPGLVDHR